MLLCNSSNPSICGVALSWKNKPQGSGVSDSVDPLIACPGDQGLGILLQGPTKVMWGSIWDGKYGKVWWGSIAGGMFDNLTLGWHRDGNIVLLVGCDI